jgi:hypothetical protein
MNRSVFLLFGCLACLLLFAGPWAAAASPAESEPADSAVPGGEPDDTGWRFTASLYLWVTGMSGDLMVRGRDVPIDLSFSDLLNASDTLVGLFGYFEGMKGRFGFALDSAYARLSADLDASVTSVGPAEISLEGGEWDFRLFVLDFAGFYRFYEVRHWSETERATRRRPLMAFDALLGGRYSHEKLELKGTVRSSVTVGDVPILDETYPFALEPSNHLVDPILGGRIILWPAERVELALWGDFGGFGAGHDFTWQLKGVAGYSFRMFGVDSSVFAGYRSLYVERKIEEGSGTLETSITLHGPVVGLVCRF